MDVITGDRLESGGRFIVSHPKSGRPSNSAKYGEYGGCGKVLSLCLCVFKHCHTEEG